MEITIMSGTQWGDEGKGKCAYYMSQFSDISIRSIGGANAGARFYHEGKKEDEDWFFRMLPAGMLRDNVGVIADGVVIGLERLVFEIDKLEQHFGDLSERLLISGNAHIILPSHIDKDAEMDEGVLNIGTVRQGNGPVHADRTLRTGVSVDEFIESEGKPDGQTKHWNNEAFLKTLKKYRANSKLFLSNAGKSGKKILIQGTQGFMLDNMHGTYPHATSANTSSMGILHGAGLPYSKVVRNIGVTKAYTTRYSQGLMPTECPPDTVAHIRSLGNDVSNDVGKNLRIGWLDIVALRYAQEINQFSELFLTKIDALSELDEIPVCIGYDTGDEVLDICHEWSRKGPAKYKPVYKNLKGWKHPIRGLQNYDELPQEAKDYIAFIEGLLETPVSYVGTGPKNWEIIDRSENV